MLSPQRVRQLIREEEIPLRARSLPAETVARIFDYGAPIGSRIECHDRLARGMERARRAYLEGHLRRPESAGRTLVESAIDWMIEVGVVEPPAGSKKKTLRLTPPYEVGKLETLIHDIGAYL